MTNELRDKLAKVYELVNRGATEGERNAAKKAMDRLLDKYGLDESQLTGINRKDYIFKYTCAKELILLSQIINMLVVLENRPVRRTWKETDKGIVRVKEVHANLTYLDYVSINCSYEYFRRHMKGQWNKLCLPIINRCRSAKAKNAKRKSLLHEFMSAYIILSNLCKEEQIIEREIKTGAVAAKVELMRNVEGGKYNKQVLSNLLLTQ